MKILAVIDMQNDFITGTLGTKEAQAIVSNVVERIREHKNDKIICTHDTHGENYPDTLEGKMLPVEHCQYKSWGWDICESVKEALNECSFVEGITKFTFGYIPWKTLIKNIPGGNDEIDEIEICGLCTDICVISNALILRASYPNTKIIVRENCCAGVTPEKHKAALEVMKSCQIEVI